MSRKRKHSKSRRRRKVGSKVRRKRWQIKRYGRALSKKRTRQRTIRKRMKRQGIL